MAVLLSQYRRVLAVDIVPEKVKLINDKKSPIADEYIEKYLGEKQLDLVATLDGEKAYSQADFVIIAAPTNYDSTQNYFDCSAVEAVILSVHDIENTNEWMLPSHQKRKYTAEFKRKIITAILQDDKEFNVICSENFFNPNWFASGSKTPYRTPILHSRQHLSKR